MINSKTGIIIKEFDIETRLFKYEQKYILDDVKTLFKELVNMQAKYEPKKGDKLWFYPGCNIPRFKVKQFCQNYDVAVVKFKEKATVRFASPDTLNQLISSVGLYQVNKNYFLKWLSSVMCNAYLELEKDLINSTSDYVYIPHGIEYKLDDQRNFKDKVLFPKGSTGHSSYTWITIADDTNYAHLNFIGSDQTLYHQDTLLSMLNTGTVMTEDMYHELNKLFESSDNSNTILAMEAMANCDFQKSAVYLLLLFKKNADKIYNSPTKHHVNFKSLIKYFKLSNYTHLTVDDLINALRYQKLLSLTNLNMLMPLIMERVRDKGDMDNIKIKDIELSPDALNSIAENILEPITPVSTEPTQESTQDNQPEESIPHATLDATPGIFN